MEITPGSHLEAAVLSAMQIAERKKVGYTVDADPDIRPQYRALAGVYELSSLILSTRAHPSFSQLLPHLRLLNDGSALQNTKSRGNDDSSNKLFELLVACLAMQLSEDVELDDPKASTGRNPDVLASIGEQRWGFACKVLHSTHPEGFLDHLRKGIDQIERSPAEVGIVVFSLKNVLPHDDLWPLVPDSSGTGLIPAAWPSPEMAQGALHYCANEIGRRLTKEIGNAGNALGVEFKDKKSVPAFLLWAPCTTGVLLEGRPVPTILRMMLGVSTGGPLRAPDQDVLEDMNWAAYYGFPWRGPRPSTGKS